MAEFLLELHQEEVPAGMQVAAAEAIRGLIEGKLKDAGLTWTHSFSESTPHRTIIVIEGLPTETPDTKEEKKGPKVGAPERAMEGFLKSAGVTLDQCEQRETPKGPVWFAVLEKKGGPAWKALAAAIDHALKTYTWPKSMRWAEHSFRWVRPLHHVLAVFDGDVLPGRFEPDAQTRFIFSDHTKGHRFMAPDAVPVSSYADYVEKLNAHKVLVSRAARRDLIRADAEKSAAEVGCRLKPDEKLLEEVVGLVEWPVVLRGRIDDEFMGVPKEVLTTSMAVHQRYLALETEDGELAPYFIAVANTETRDGGKAVIAGNERVLRARLSDAKFFWDQDRAVPLADRLERLQPITFHAKLGSVAERVTRLTALATALAPLIEGCDSDDAARAATLCKADLVTGMVGEFPELQGLMGRYYALDQGEDAAVADAVAQHYSPAGPSDACPSQPVAVAVALADKLDVLMGFFTIGETPTGSRDPFALRRAALGVVRLVLENGLRLPLREVLSVALAQYRGQLDTLDSGAVETLVGFFADRLKVVLKDRGVRHDLIDAVMALAAEDDLLRLVARAEALQALLATEDGANLLTAYRRAANIVGIEAKKDKVDGFGPLNAADLGAEPATALLAALDGAGAPLAEAIAAEDYTAACQVLAGLRAPVDGFFDQVVVNDEDPAKRAARLALLTRITETINGIAYFGRVLD